MPRITPEVLRQWVKEHPGMFDKVTVSLLMGAAKEIERLTPDPAASLARFRGLAHEEMRRGPMVTIKPEPPEDAA